MQFAFIPALSKEWRSDDFEFRTGVPLVHQRGRLNEDVLPLPGTDPSNKSNPRDLALARKELRPLFHFAAIGNHIAETREIDP